MIITKNKIKNDDVVDVCCDKCATEFTRKLKNVKTARRKNNDIDICPTCSRKAGAVKRPQNSKEFWEQNMKSDAYYVGIENRDTSGANNGMWNKNHTPESIVKMSKSRTGKLGKNATAWKGGKAGVNKMVSRRA